MYLAYKTRPNITFVVEKLNKYKTNFKKSHF